MTPIGSPRVPPTAGSSSLATPVTRNDAGPDDSALAARLASPAMPPSHAAATPLHATPAECPAAAIAAIALRRQRAPFALCCRSCFVSSSVLLLPTASRFAPSTTDTYQSWPLSLREDPEGARALFGSGQGESA